MMAQKLRFSRGLKAKVPGAVTARVPAPTPLVEIFTGSAPIDWTQEATMVKVRIFFFYLRGSFQMYDCYFTNVLAQRSCFEVLLSVLTAGSLCFTPDDARTFVPTIPRRRRAFTVSWNIEFFVHSNSASGVVIFLPTRRPRHQFPLPANLHRHSRHTHFQQDETSSLLDRRRHESRQTYRSYQLTLHLGTSTTLFPAIWTRTARSTEELFSQWTRPKRASSDQQTDEEDTSETCNNNHVGGRTMTNAKKRNWGRTYIYVLGHRDGRFGDVYIRPMAVNGLSFFLFWTATENGKGQTLILRTSKENTQKAARLFTTRASSVGKDGRD